MQNKKARIYRYVSKAKRRKKAVYYYLRVTISRGAKFTGVDKMISLKVHDLQHAFTKAEKLIKALREKNLWEGEFVRNKIYPKNTKDP